MASPRSAWTLTASSSAYTVHNFSSVCSLRAHHVFIYTDRDTHDSFSFVFKFNRKITGLHAQVAPFLSELPPSNLVHVPGQGLGVDGMVRWHYSERCGRIFKITLHSLSPPSLPPSLKPSARPTVMLLDRWSVGSTQEGGRSRGRPGSRARCDGRDCGLLVCLAGFGSDSRRGRTRTVSGLRGIPGGREGGREGGMEEGRGREE